MTYVLVHGAWAGGWNWDLLKPLLEDGGASVLAPSLLGLGDGDRVSAEIGLDDHVAQISDLLVSKDVRDAVLVGHSYGGMVITGVAARHPDRVARLVYVDAFVPAPGGSPADILPFLPAVFDSLSVDGLAQPPDLGELFGLTEDELRWVDDRLRPMPRRAPTDSIGEFDPQLLDERDPVFVLCLTRPDFADSARALEGRGWRVVRLQTHHYPMISMPETLARVVSGDDSGPELASN